MSIDDKRVKVRSVACQIPDRAERHSNGVDHEEGVEDVEGEVVRNRSLEVYPVSI